MSSAKWRSLCLDLKVLNIDTHLQQPGVEDIFYYGNMNKLSTYLALYDRSPVHQWSPLTKDPFHRALMLNFLLSSTKC